MLARPCVVGRRGAGHNSCDNRGNEGQVSQLRLTENILLLCVSRQLRPDLPEGVVEELHVDNMAAAVVYRFEAIL